MNLGSLLPLVFRYIHLAPQIATLLQDAEPVISEARNVAPEVGVLARRMVHLLGPTFAELRKQWPELAPVMAQIGQQLTPEFIATVEQHEFKFDMAWIQESLNLVAGEELRTDGVFGEETKQATERYQHSEQMELVDGFPGPVTCAALYAARKRLAETKP